MSARKARRRPTMPRAPVPPSPEQSDDLRDRLFKALSIIACCRLACASLLDQGGNLEVMTDALQAAYDLIDATAGELEVIGGKAGAS
ncbi:MAG: hypothetical protein ACYCT1_15965 [Steroidobacteraceae bacterium]